MTKALFEFMEDFDNPELSDFDRREQLQDSVLEFNAEFGTEYPPHEAFKRYEDYLRRRHNEY